MRRPVHRRLGSRRRGAAGAKKWRAQRSLFRFARTRTARRRSYLHRAAHRRYARSAAEIARHAASHALVTDAPAPSSASRKPLRNSSPGRWTVLSRRHPMAARTLRLRARGRGPFPQRHLRADERFRGEPRSARGRLRENSRENGARPVWLGAKQHDYAVGLASHLRNSLPWRWRRFSTIA